MSDTTTLSCALDSSDGLNQGLEGPAHGQCKTCTKCRLLLPLENFWVDPHHKTGRSSWCASCYKKRDEEKKRANKETGACLEGITCNVCRIWKPASECVKDSRRRGGLDGRCRECFRKRLNSQKATLTNHQPVSKINKPRMKNKSPPQAGKAAGGHSGQLQASTSPDTSASLLLNLQAESLLLPSNIKWENPTMSGPPQLASLDTSSGFGTIQTSMLTTGSAGANTQPSRRSTPPSSTHLSPAGSCAAPLHTLTASSTGNTQQQQQQQQQQDSEGEPQQAVAPLEGSGPFRAAASTSTPPSSDAAQLAAPSWTSFSTAPLLAQQSDPASLPWTTLTGQVADAANSPDLLSDLAKFDAAPPAQLTPSPFLSSTTHMFNLTASDPGALPASLHTLTSGQDTLAGGPSACSSRQRAADDLQLGSSYASSSFQTMVSHLLQNHQRSQLAQTAAGAGAGGGQVGARRSAVGDKPPPEQPSSQATLDLSGFSALINWELGMSLGSTAAAAGAAAADTNPAPGAAAGHTTHTITTHSITAGALIESGSTATGAHHVFNPVQSRASGAAVVTTGVVQSRKPPGLQARPARLFVPDPASEPPPPEQPTAMLISPTGAPADTPGCGPITLSPSPRPVLSPHDGGLPGQMFDWAQRPPNSAGRTDIDIDALSMSFRSLMDGGSCDAFSMASPASIALVHPGWMDVPGLNSLSLGVLDSDPSELCGLCDEEDLAQLLNGDGALTTTPSGPR